MVVIAGKGHEQGQEFAGGRKEPFDDVAVAREALRAVARHEDWDASQVAAAAGATLARAAPRRARTRVIDSRAIGRRPVRRPARRERRRRPVRGGSARAGAWGVS